MRNDKINRYFVRYTAIYDSRMGYLAGIDYGQSKQTPSTETASTKAPTTLAPFAGGRAQVFIMENIPIGLFLHLSSNLMTQDVQQRIFWDPALQASLLTTLPQDR
jgi:hypothetical protein